MSNHTPGPWVIYDDGPDGSDVILAHIDEENYDIAYIAADERPEDEKKANARLIAAAPELLSALKILLEDHKRMFPEAHPYSTIKWSKCVEVKRARAVIAKAEGRDL